MRIPKRRGEEEARHRRALDPHLTPAKIERLKVELVKLEKEEQPRAAAEVRRTAEMGDLSENAAYQEAKDSLRRINNRILSLRSRIANAIPIATGPDAFGRVTLGATVRCRIGDRERTFEIVGAQEVSPARGRISTHSPVGAALLGHKTGDIVTVTINGAQQQYTILSVQ